MDATTIADKFHLAIKLILESELSVFLDERTRSDLNEALECDDASYLSMSFRAPEDHGSTNCNVYMRTGTRGRNSYEKEDGSVWSKEVILVEVNYPTHGGADPVTTAKRLAFCASVNALALQVMEQCCGEFEVCIRTGEENARHKAEIEAERAKAAVLRTIRAAVDTCRSGMRVGQTRNVPAALLSGVESGNHPVLFEDYNGKAIREYVLTVNVDRPHDSFVRRKA